jgi:hypothetical protein
MAAMVLAMLFIGIGMISTLQPKFLTLIAVHRPLGIAILLLAIFRLGVRLRRGAPSLPADLPPAGDARVQTAVHDLGTGAYTVIGQMAAERLGVPLSSVAVELGDSRLPVGPVAGGSNTTASACSAMIAALFRPGEVEMIAQCIEQGGAHVKADAVFLTIHAERYVCRLTGVIELLAVRRFGWQGACKRRQCGG